MSTNQPVWKLLANLGDVNPIDHGGYFIYADTTGKYDPEGEILESLDDNEGEAWYVYRFSLEKCTYQNGVLSDNSFHPDHPAWFATPESGKASRPQDTTYLSNVAQTMGTTIEELIKGFCSDDPIKRAYAYQMVGQYHGFENFDTSPIRYTGRADVEARYHEPEYQVIVGNVGTVDTTTDEAQARAVFKEYVYLSGTGLGRAGDEPVTLLKDGEIVEEYQGGPHATQA